LIAFNNLIRVNLVCLGNETDFIFDTGANDIMINENFEHSLFLDRKISRSNYLEASGL